MVGWRLPIQRSWGLGHSLVRSHHTKAAGSWSPSFFLWCCNSLSDPHGEMNWKKSAPPTGWVNTVLKLVMLNHVVQVAWCSQGLKFFNLLQPDVAIFGQKDAMQCVVIARMLEDCACFFRVTAAGRLGMYFFSDPCIGRFWPHHEAHFHMFWKSDAETRGI